jgi:hypothetical protein
VMDFGLRGGDRDQVFIRILAGMPLFLLYSPGETEHPKVEALRLHVDFPRAEVDASIGPQARGTGVLHFRPDGPAQIVSRDMRNARAADIGFVLDVASPYPINKWLGIPPHALASKLRTFKDAMQRAYTQYREHKGRYRNQVPVYDVTGWEQVTYPDARAGYYRPTLLLVGFTPVLSAPLTERLKPIAVPKPRPRLLPPKRVNA